MPDHALFLAERRKPMVVRSEVKTVQCGLNGPWTDPERQSMQKVLCAGGFRPADQVGEIARALYGHGVWQDEPLVINIVCLGSRHNSGLARSRPSVPQLIWHHEVLPFIYRRFDEYKLEKQMHHQWDVDARQLFAAARQAANAGELVASVEVVDKL